MENSSKPNSGKINWLLVLLAIIIAGGAGYWLGHQKDKLAPLVLKSTIESVGIRSAQPIDTIDAQKFILSLHNSLDSSGDLVTWPKDNTGERVTSWFIDIRYIELIQQEINKIDASKYPFKGLRFYPVRNSKGEFSIMLVGGYNDGKGNDFILKHSVNARGEQDTVGSAPMYEWLDPCPPFHCPDNDFKFK